MTSRPSRFARLRAAAFTVIALAGLAAACETHLPTSAEVQRMDARGAERQIANRAVFDSVTTYEVDGVPVTRAKAMSIPSSEIATIMVQRRVTPVGCLKNSDGSETCTASSQVLPGSQLSIRTRAFAATAETTTVRATADDGGVRVDNGAGSANREFKGLILIDGVRADRAALAALPPNGIMSVEVLKGAAAKAYSAPEAAYGVILVTTIHGKRQ